MLATLRCCAEKSVLLHIKLASFGLYACVTMTLSPWNVPKDKT